MRDRLKQIADTLPKMNYPDGTPINHHARLKKVHQLGGTKAVQQYIKAVNKVTRRDLRRMRWARLLIKFGLKKK